MDGATAGGPDAGDDAGYGEVVVDLDLRGLRAQARVEADEMNVIIGDGDSAVVLTTSWTTRLDDAADSVEAVGNRLLHLAVVLRERAERKRRPLPRGAFPEMGTAPTVSGESVENLRCVLSRASRRPRAVLRGCGGSPHGTSAADLKG